MEGKDDKGRYEEQMSLRLPRRWGEKWEDGEGNSDLYQIFSGQMAQNETNQYFVATHNPYFLSTVLEKTPQKEIGIFITYFENYQTKVQSLTEQGYPEVFDLGSDVFFNLEKFLEKS